MAVDYPDGTLPIGITANYIGNLPIDIKAQTIATLSIAVITMPSVTIGTWAAGTLTIQGSVTILTMPSVTIGVWSAGVLTVDGSVAVTSLPSVTIGVWSAGTLVVSGSVAVTSIPTVTIGTWTAGTLVISGSVVVTSIPTVTIGVWSAGTLTIDGSVIVSSMPAITIGTWNAGTLTVTATITSMPSVTIGTWNAGTLNVATALGVALTVTVGTWNAGTINVAVTSIPSVTIATWSAGTLTVNINTMPSVTIATWSAGTLAVSVATLPNITIGTWSAGTLNVSIASSVAITIGTWSAGTLSIDITAATIGALNIKTSGGINIILDKLTTDAYTERRSTISNNGAPTGWTYATGNIRQAKFFPRGCRGFIATIDAYCKDTGVGGGTITVYLAPYIGAGYVTSAVITVPAGGGEAWRSATFNRMWNYDSLFIFVATSTNEIQFGFDVTAPYDYYYSLDAGATWTADSYRYDFRAVFQGETCGDVPVSGTVNNIEIPSSTTSGVGANVTVHTNTETSIASVTGAGKIARIHLYTTYENMAFHFYIDGVMLNVTSFTGHFEFAPSSLKVLGFTASTPKIQLLRYDVGGYYDIGMDIQFNFKRSFEIKAYHEAGSDRIASVSIVANLIS